MFPRRLRRHRSIGYCALSLIATAPLLGAAPSAVPSRNASLPFAADGGVRDWQADGTQGIWVQGTSGSWYYGRFSFPCTGLPFRETLRFKFSPGGALDRWSAVSTREAGNCPFKSFETSAGPPVAAKKNKAAPPAAVPPAGTTPQ